MTKAVYRNKLIKRMGGEPGFDFLVATYCENIQDDESLDRFFGNFDFNTLICLQKEFLLISFLEPYEETEPRKKRVMFRNDMMGIDGSVFPILEEHFVGALEDCCIGGLDFELCKAYFSELNGLFKESTDQSKYRENIVERMGGESTLEFMVLSYCERLEEDERLSCYFESLNGDNMTLLQKELILMAILHPNANTDFEGLRRRVTSKFSPLFELGMNREHFEMMESHFSAAVYECLTETDVIQDSTRLFANLITFFEDNSFLFKRGYEEYEEEDEDEEMESDTEFDSDYEEDDSLCSMTEDFSVLSPMPSRYVTNRVQEDALNQSERSSDSVISIHSFESRTTRTARTTGNESYVSRRIQEALEKSERASRTGSAHSRTNRSERRTRRVSKTPIQDVSDGCDPLKHSERTEDTVSTHSGDSIRCIQPAQVKIKQKGRAKMSFSWKACRSPIRRKNTKNLRL